MSRQILLFICIVAVLKGVVLADKWKVDATWRTWRCAEDKDGSITITGVRPGTRGALTVPRSFQGVPVRRIGKEAFRDNALLTEITITGDIVSIGDRAFQGCSKLRKLNFLEGIHYIDGSDAFRGCSSLRVVTLPKGLEFIRQRAFKYCEKIERVNVDSIEDYLSIRFGTGSSTPLCSNNACLYTNGVKIVSLIIPPGTMEIKSCSFCRSGGMREICIPGSVIKMGSWSLACDISTDILISSDIGTLDLAPYVAGDDNRQTGNIRILPKGGCPFVKWIDSNGKEVKHPFHSSIPITVSPCWLENGVNIE